MSVVDQRLTQQEKERKAQDLGRLAQQAVGEREWDRALAFCDEALALSPASNTLVALRKSVVEGKQTQEKVSQLLAESANARKVGELTRAQARAATAQRLDPHNSQVLALCRLLEQEIEEKRLKEELRKVMTAAREHLAAREYEEAFVLLDKAWTIAPDTAEVIHAKDELTAALMGEKRKSIVRRLEEKAALSTTVDKLRSVSTELAEALKEFPNDPSLLRLRLNLEPRIKQLEDEHFVKEVCKTSAELPPEQAVGRIRAALQRVPGNEQLFGLESALSERLARQAREQLLSQRLGQARQAIDDRLFLEAVKILERCKAEGYSSYEVDGLLELAKSTASQRISQELLERTYSQAKRFIDEEDYDSAVQLLRRALRQVDEPVLHRQLEEATQKQSAVEQSAASALERAESLTRMELFTEAVVLLEEQSPGVKRLPRVDQALGRARRFQEAEADFAGLTGRCYAQMGTSQGAHRGPEARALALPASPDSPGSLETTKKQLRRRCEQVYGEKASSAGSRLRASYSARTTVWVPKRSLRRRRHGSSSPLRKLGRSYAPLKRKPPRPKKSYDSAEVRGADFVGREQTSIEDFRCRRI